MPNTNVQSYSEFEQQFINEEKANTQVDVNGGRSSAGGSPQTKEFSSYVFPDGK